MNRLFLALMLLSVYPAFAQEGIAVPDLTGLTVPAAAAQLNRAGLRLGEQSIAPLAESVAENTIAVQNPAPGTLLEAGASVDVSIVYSPNVRLIYDDNDLTMINIGTTVIGLENIIFQTTETTRAQASFAASGWRARLSPGQCGQIWSVVRNSPKSIAGCENIRWLSSTNANVHFWTQLSGAVRFTLLVDGEARGDCAAAGSNTQNAPLTCEVALGAAGSDNTPYLYLLYSTDTLVILNQTADQWMRAHRTTIRSLSPDVTGFAREFTPGDPELFGNPDTVAEINRLAPGQCLLFTTGTESIPPQPCDVVAARTVGMGEAWWQFDFEVLGRDDTARVCKAAVSPQLTICVMPR